MSPEFILGLIAGEGTFNVALHRDGPRGVRPRPQFSLRLDKRDGSVIRACQATTGLGTVSDGGEMAQWSVSSKEDMERLVDYIDTHSVQSGFKKTDKFRSFVKWKRAVNIYGGSLTEEEVKEMIHLAKTMNQTESHNKLSEEEWLEAVK